MKESYGLLMHTPRWREPLKVLLVHPGGPFWRRVSDGAWSIPKGLANADELPLEAAKREFFEETGLQPQPPFHELTPITQKGGKRVRCWATEAEECTVTPGASRFEIEWPPRSGRRATFPEIDDARFLSLKDALVKIIPAQAPFLREIEQSHLSSIG